MKMGRFLQQTDDLFWGPTFRSTITAMGVIFSMLFSVYLNSCSETDDKSRILRIIASAAKQAEEHNVSGLLDHTLEAFTAQPGNHDRRSVRGILWWAFRHYGKLSIMYPQPTITVGQDNEIAVAEVHFLIVKKEGKVPDLKELAKDPQQWLRAVGENADLYRLQLELIKTDGRWKVNVAHLAPYAATGF